MKPYIVLLWLFFVASCSYAQIFSGYLYDLKTGLPISNVEVYFDGTLFHTTTDASGKFELYVGTRINTNLIFRHSSYQLKSISNPYEEGLGKIYLEKKVDPIWKVTQADLFSREQKIKVFREQFLGTDKAGKSCKILNEDDIHFFYDSDTKNLSAVSNQPLIIENKL
ncbi:MAG: carboxypeptidase-like regulatory domain-containing protein [Bacteroidales bacterium]|nr:carboxypeptidase-like regulatory domain-containing protein [Bacteroidales bacterium]